MKQCTFCHTFESDRWWKCCPTHCTERGVDVVCTTCVKVMHNLCVIRDCDALGTTIAPVVLGTVLEHGGIKLSKRQYDVFLCYEHKHLYKPDNIFIGHLVSQKVKRTIIENS